jgi:putative membrane protein
MTDLKKCLPVVLTVAVLALAVCAARAQKDQKDPEPIKDPDFLVQAFTAGTADVKLGELAAKQATDEKVKAFAQKMVKEHGMMNDKLAEMAKGLKLAVVTGLEKDAKATYDQLAKLKGAEFDREYMKVMVADHEKAVTLFEREAKTGTDAGLKAFAIEHVAHVKDHLKEAREILDGIKDKKE